MKPFIHTLLLLVVKHCTKFPLSLKLQFLTSIASSILESSLTKPVLVEKSKQFFNRPLEKILFTQLCTFQSLALACMSTVARLHRPGKFVAATSREGLISARTKRFPSRLKRPTILRAWTMKVLLQSLFIRFLKPADLGGFVRKRAVETDVVCFRMYFGELQIETSQQISQKKNDLFSQKDKAQS